MATQPAWWQPVVLALTTAVVFLPVANLTWIWDDDQYVYANPMLLNWDGLKSIWLEPSKTPQYYPITFTALWCQFRAYDISPAGYHVFNLILHVSNGLLCLTILRRMRVQAAFWIALAFSLHPIQVETVAWVTEIKNLLSGLFYGLTWLVLWPALEQPEQNPERQPRLRTQVLRYLLAIVFFACALGSKSITASLPAAMLVALWYRSGNLRRQHVLLLLPMLLFGALAGWRTASLERQHVGAFGPEWEHGIFERVGIAARSLWHYLQNCVVPQEQMFFYPRFATTLTGAAWLAIGFWTVVLVALTYWAWNSGKRGPLACLAFFVGSVFPALGFLNVYPHRFSFVADHFVYLPVLGIFCFLWSVLLSVALSIQSRWQTSPLLAALPLLIVLGIYALHTSQHIPVFRSEKTLWEDTLAKNPQSVAAMQNLSLVYMRMDNASGALQLLEQARESEFDRYQTWNSLGLVYSMLGRIEDAESAFRKSASENSTNPQPWVNLGNLTRNLPLPQLDDDHDASSMEELERERREKVRGYYQRAWDTRPDYLAAFGMAMSLYEAEDFSQAAMWFERAAKIRPWDLDARFNAAQSHFSAGDKSASARLCREILVDFPANPTATGLLAKCESISQ